MTTIKVRAEGVSEILAKYGRMPHFLASKLKAAGKDAGVEVVNTRGLKNYPPPTGANAPPVPYYVRGVGTQYASRNLGNSEQYGARWDIKPGTRRTVVSNSASYAPYLAGERQARAMARIGWRKLFDVAKEKMRLITEIFSKAVDSALRQAGLK